MWTACLRECTCQPADASETATSSQELDNTRCPHKRSEGHPFAAIQQTQCPTAKDCAPCKFVDTVKLKCQYTSKLMLNVAEAFSYRVMLSEPISTLLDATEAAFGTGTQKSRDVKTIVYDILLCEERFLHNIRALGKLVTVCPQMAELRIMTKISKFWEMMRVIGRAVSHQTSDKMKEHAVARVQLLLANHAKTESDFDALKEWFTYFTVGQSHDECTLFTQELKVRDVWEACTKVFASETVVESEDEVMETDEEEAPTEVIIDLEAITEIAG